MHCCIKYCERSLYNRDAYKALNENTIIFEEIVLKL